MDQRVAELQRRREKCSEWNRASGEEFNLEELHVGGSPNRRIVRPEFLDQNPYVVLQEKAPVEDSSSASKPKEAEAPSSPEPARFRDSPQSKRNASKEVQTRSNSHSKSLKANQTSNESKVTKAAIDKENIKPIRDTQAENAMSRKTKESPTTLSSKLDNQQIKRTDSAKKAKKKLQPLALNQSLLSNKASGKQLNDRPQVKLSKTSTISPPNSIQIHPPQSPSPERHDQDSKHRESTLEAMAASLPGSKMENCRKKVEEVIRMKEEMIKMKQKAKEDQERNDEKSRKDRIMVSQVK